VYHSNAVFITSTCWLVSLGPSKANFREPRNGEVPGIHLLRTSVNRGKKTGRGYYAPALEYAVRRYPLEGLTNR
jgi:hypothetical protein